MIPSSESRIPLCPPIAPLEPLHSWIPLTPLEVMSETDYDVLIVGSGAGGGAVLWRLCDQWKSNGKRIGMIEAGDLLLPTHRRNLAILSGGRAEKLFENPEVTRQIGRTLPEFSGAKQIFALGGRMLQWDLNANRMPLHSLSRYPVPLKEMEVYYDIAERAMKVTRPYIQNGALNEKFLNRLQTNGYPEARDPWMAMDMKPTRYGEVHSNAYFSSIDFLAEALNRKGFDLAIKARAVQILTEKGKAAGLKVMSSEKKSYILHAKNVVVSASTLETPRLLLYSGINGCAIGKYLINHSSVKGTAVVNRSDFPDLLGAIEVMIPETVDRRYQMQLYGRGQPSQDEVGVGINGFGLVEPRPENRITLDPYSMDEYGVPRIRVHFSYSQADLDVIREMTVDMRKVLTTIGAAPVSVDGQPELCLRPPGEDNHESGTCRIGDDPDTSAADRYGQIHGISGLYVADNSMLPYLGTNPTLTTTALAIRTADYIIRGSLH